MTRKIELMHDMFGAAAGHKCAECSNLIERQWDKVYRKCSVYGISNSEATDWALSYPACGMLNIPYIGGRPIKDFIHKDLEREDPIEGQTMLEAMKTEQ